MAYFKWDKETGATIVTEIKQAAADLKSITESIDLFVQECDGKPDNLKGWEKEVKDDGGWFWKLLWDWTGDYDDFMRRLKKVQEKNNTMKSGGKVKLETLSNALAELQLIIETFDDPNAFSLRNAYEGKENVEIAYNADGVEVIVYTAPDGTRYTMSEMLNAFYTYTGMSMDGQLQGYLYAQQNGVEFNSAYQSNILAGVNSTVGSIHNIGGFGVASSQDILGVNSYLSQDPSYRSMLEIDANGNLVNNTGGSWYSNMEVGSSYLSTYTIADYLIDPNKAYDEGLLERPVEEVGEEATEEGITRGLEQALEEGDITRSTGGGMPTADDQSDGDNKNESVPDKGGETDEKTGGGGPTVKDETTDDNKVESKPGDEEGNDSKDGDSDSNGDDTSKVEEKIDLDQFENEKDAETFETEIKDDYDELAREKYEAQDPDVITERRENVINETQKMIDNNDTDGLRNKLADYGYSEGDIDKIVNDPDALISAMIEGDTRKQLSDYAKDIAEKDGVDNYDTKYDDGQSYQDYKDGSSSSLTTNRSNDPEVKQAQKEYNDARTEYKDATDKVNDAASKTKENLDNVNSFKQRYGSDTSKWSDREKADYKEAVQKYQESRDDYNQKREAYNEAKTNYNDAYNRYEEAKDNYDQKIRDSVRENDVQFEEERAKHETVVEVDDSALLDGTNTDMTIDTTNKNVVAENNGLALADNSASSTPVHGGTGATATAAPEINPQAQYTDSEIASAADSGIALVDNVEVITGDTTGETTGTFTAEIQQYPGTPRVAEEPVLAPYSEEIKTIPGTPRPAEELVATASEENVKIPGTPAPATGEIAVGETFEKIEAFPGTPPPADTGTLAYDEGMMEEIKIYPGTPAYEEARLEPISKTEYYNDTTGTSYSEYYDKIAPAGSDSLNAEILPYNGEQISAISEIAPTAGLQEASGVNLEPQIGVYEGKGVNTISVNDAALLNIISDGEMRDIKAKREE